jgi:hypothetical protein
MMTSSLFPPVQSWVSLIVCNFAVLASALLRLSDTTPDGTIYSSSGRRVGVRVVPPQQSLVNFSPARTRHDGKSEEERSGDVELSKLGLTTTDLELDVSAISMTRTNSPSPPATTMFKGQNVDPGV